MDNTVNNFHKYCINKGPTFTFVKASNGFKFGGYTPKSWTSVGTNGTQV